MLNNLTNCSKEKQGNVHVELCFENYFSVVVTYNFMSSLQDNFVS